MMNIRKACPGEENRILEFYHQLIQDMQGSPYPLRWEKGTYPVLSDILAAVKEESLYVAEESEHIIGAFILNHKQGDGYALADWKLDSGNEKIAVLHLLATSPAYQGKGMGRKMLEKAVAICRSQRDLSIRLDTLPWNVPGKKLYESFGFQYRGDIELDYPSTGKIAFSLYELIL